MQLFPQQVIRQRKRKGVGGGPWRAYVSQEKAHTNGKANFRALAAGYRQVLATDPARLKQLRDMGAAARMVAKNRAGKRSAFGPTAREVQRTALKKVRQALWQQSCALSPLEKAIFITEHSLVQRGDMAHALRVARTVQRLDGATEREKVEKQKEALAAWRDAAGACALEEFKSLLPELATQDLKMLPVPCSRGLALELPAIARPSASMAAAWASSTRTTQLSSALQQLWEEMHIPVKHEDMDHAVKKVSDCCLAGRCLCCAGGKLLVQFKREVHKVMKAHLGTAACKCRLGQGAYVFKFNMAGEDTINNLHVPDSNDAAVLWLHVSLMYWSPYRATFAKLKPVPCPGGEIECDGRVYLQVCVMKPKDADGDTDDSDPSLGEPKGWTSFCCPAAWVVSILEVESSGRPLVALHPGIVSVCLVPGLGDLHVWPPKRKPRAKKRTKRTTTKPTQRSSAASSSDAVPLPQSDDELEDEQSDGDRTECEEEELASNMDLEEIFGIDSLLLRAEALQHLGDDLLLTSAEVEHPAGDQVGDTVANDLQQPTPQETMPLPAASSVQPNALVEDEKQPLVCTAQPSASSNLEESTSANRRVTVGTPRGLVGTAAASVWTPNGRISYYAGKSMFEAVCSRHKNCKLSRTSNGTKQKNDC
eukprot:6480794-Amphidinium_carterae.2